MDDWQRTTWATAGMVVFVGFVGTGITWIATATPTRPFWPLVPFFALAVLGLYEFVAAVTPWMWFHYPGKKSVQHHKKATVGMKIVLGLYLARTQALGRGNLNDNAPMIREWAFSLAKLVSNGWGSHEVMLLGIEGEISPRDQLVAGKENLRSLIRQTGCSPEGHFKWDTNADWNFYISNYYPSQMRDVNQMFTGEQ